MASLDRQIGAVTALNLRSIPQRAAMSIATVVAVALAVSVLTFFLALVQGLDATMKGSGAADVAIVIRSGSESELNSVINAEELRVIETAPGVARAGEKPLISGELLVIVDGIKKSSGTKANMPFRGIGREGLSVRRGFKITQGRMFTPGTNEIVVGAGLLREFQGFEYGKAIRLRGAEWRVVGVFENPGTVFESELWADVAVTQSLFNRPNTYQIVRARLTSPAALAAFKQFVSKDPRLQLEALSEQEYFAKQAEMSGLIFKVIAWPLGIVMAIGALAGAMNTMYSSVSARAAEIATLRIIGFSGLAAFAGTMIEALALALIGAAIGLVICYLAFNGLTSSTLGGGFTQIVFEMKVGPDVIVNALVVALVIGLVGGFFPGLRAARQSALIGLAQ